MFLQIGDIQSGVFSESLAQTGTALALARGVASSILLVTSTHHLNIIPPHNVVKERYAQG